MSFRLYISFLVLTFIIFTGCCKQPLNYESSKLKFAVAGHVYGNPITYTSTIYPPFLKALLRHEQQNYLNFLFLTGDVVPHPTDSNWKTAIAELNMSHADWHIAPGNHDFGGSIKYPFQRKYKAIVNPEPFHFFRFRNNEFIVLNTSHNGWTINEIQKNSLASYLNQIKENETENIFVFTHQLWWLNDPPDKFQLDSIQPNSDAMQLGSSNFWKDAFFMFSAFEIPIWFFAGDVGCLAQYESYYEDHYQNFHFYASGMGGGIKDNYLIVEVSEQGKVNIEKRIF